MSKQFCLRGHDTFVVGRSKLSRNCNECARLDTLKHNRNLTSEERIKERDELRKYVAAHRDKDRAWQRKNDRLHKDTARKYEMRNRVRIRAQSRAWYAKNKLKDEIFQRRCDLKRQHRVPNWGQEGIPEFYQNRPLGMIVDHYYPLNGRLCSGLHVIWNLRHITQSENLHKGNKMPEEFYGAVV